ncbi:MAG: hypothetical protein IPG59_11895 [Candidatus Melainabacteria bacterium]|nr:MAG: hypothetical protein IPG59_11895 [Candidatus Melainabacteria bacterium]
MHFAIREDHRCVRNFVLSLGDEQPLVSGKIYPPGIRNVGESCDQMPKWKVVTANSKVIGVEVLGFVDDEEAAKQLVVARYTKAA